MGLRLIGNKDTLNNIGLAAARNRLPHAIIIEGEEGSGKHSLAKFISAALLCESNEPPCEGCRICRLIEKDGHTDVSVFSPEGATFKVSQVRDIREKAYVLPLEGKRKVFVLSGADKMNKQSQNALLKIIEEPPSFLTFILLCENSEAFLPTIISRCVKFRTALPTKDEALEHLLSLGKDLAEVENAVELSGGNIGKAIQILDNAVSPTVAASKELFEAFKREDRLSALKIFHAFEKNREDCILLLSQFKDLIFAELKKEFASSNSLKKISLYNSCIEKIAECIKKIKQNGNTVLLCTSLCAEISVLFDK